MATVDYRVRLLTDLLMDRGFAWLAREIIDSIEIGAAPTADRDQNVTSQRRALNVDASRDVPQEDLEESSLPDDEPREPLTPEAQVQVAVELLVRRLSDMGRMFESSRQTLKQIFDVDVTLSIELAGEPRQYDPGRARELTSQLESVREQLFEWLMSQPSEGG
jgi:hypothetical protein